MDDKLLRLAKKIKSIENELQELSKAKNIKNLLYMNSELEKYKNLIESIIDTYESQVNKIQKELNKELKDVREQSTKISDKDEKSKKELNNKVDKIKKDIEDICKGIDKSITDIQEDITKKIKEQSEKIKSNNKLKDKEISEIKKENERFKLNIKELKKMFNNLELQKGEAGKSAYEIACELGFKGTVEEWIKSLHGKDGKDIELRGMRGFSDTPKDNKIYGRKNKKWVEIPGGSGGTSDYSDLNNKPSINNVELSGNKSLNDLGIQPAGNYLESETDPTVPSYVKSITENDITSWGGKLDASKVKSSISTTAGDVYDVTYINTMIGDIETILTTLTTGGGVE